MMVIMTGEFKFIFLRFMIAYTAEFYYQNSGANLPNSRKVVGKVDI